MFECSITSVMFKNHQVKTIIKKKKRLCTACFRNKTFSKATECSLILYSGVQDSVFMAN